MTHVANEDALMKLIEGTKLMTYPVTGDRLRASAKCFEEAIAHDSGTSYENARKDGKGFPRAWTRYAYCRMTEYLEDFADEKALTDAEEFTSRALAHPAGTYDSEPHWDRAFYLYLTRQFDDAVKEIDRAMALDPRDMDIVVEASDIYVAAGRLDDALALIDRAGRVVCHDWFRWSKAWGLYFKGRQDKSYYDLAIQEIRRMYWNPGEPQYMYDVQLLLASTLAMKGDSAKATQALALFQRDKSYWTIAKETRARPFKDDALQAHWMEGCKKAGLK